MAAMLDMLFEAIEDGRSKGMLSEILKELVAYAGYHFDAEGQLMIKHHYPDLGEHHKEHEAFRVKVLEFQRSFREGRETLTGDVIKFMTHMDKKYAPFLNARRVF